MCCIVPQLASRNATAAALPLAKLAILPNGNRVAPLANCDPPKPVKLQDAILVFLMILFGESRDAVIATGCQSKKAVKDTVKKAVKDTVKRQ
jgi:hypothetical protein